MSANAVSAVCHLLRLTRFARDYLLSSFVNAVKGAAKEPLVLAGARKADGDHVAWPWARWRGHPDVERAATVRYPLSTRITCL